MVTEHNSIQHNNEVFAQWYIGSTGIILGVGPANGGRRYGAPIGRAHTKYDP